MDLDTLLFMLEKLKGEGLPGNTPITVGIPEGFNEQFESVVVAHGKYLDSTSTACACLPVEGLYIRLESDSTDKTGEPWAYSYTEQVLPINKKLRIAKDAFRMLPQIHTFIVDITPPDAVNEITYTNILESDIGKLVECEDGTLDVYDIDGKRIGKLDAYRHPDDYRNDLTKLGFYSYCKETKTYTPNWIKTNDH